MKIRGILTISDDQRHRQIIPLSYAVVWVMGFSASIFVDVFDGLVDLFPLNGVLTSTISNFVKIIVTFFFIYIVFLAEAYLSFKDVGLVNGGCLSREAMLSLGRIIVNVIFTLLSMFLYIITKHLFFLISAGLCLAAMKFFTIYFANNADLYISCNGRVVLVAASLKKRG